MGELVKVESAGVGWVVEGAWAEALGREVLPIVGDLTQHPTARLRKQSLLRTVYRVTLGDGRTVMVKEYRLRALKDRLKRLLLGPKPLREWRASRRLLDRGVPASHAVAVGLPASRSGVVEGYLVVEALPDVVGVGSYAAARPPSLVFRHAARGTESDAPLAVRPAEPEEGFVGELAGFVRRLHDAGVSHYDLHGGNILVRTSLPAGAERFVVIDLHRIRVGRPPGPRHRAAAIAQLAGSLVGSWEAAPRVVEEFLGAYLGAGEAMRSPLLTSGRIVGLMRRRAAVRVRSRARRCLMNSSRFVVDRIRGWRIYHSREFLAAELLSLWEEHKAGAPAGGVSRFPWEEGVLELTEYPPRGALARLLTRSPAVRAYAAAHRLRGERGSGPEAVAAADCREGPDRGRSFAVLLRREEVDCAGAPG